jgi:hypothetical protein
MPSGNGYSYNSSGTNSQVHLSLFLKAHYKENQNIHGNSLLFEHWHLNSMAMYAYQTRLRVTTTVPVTMAPAPPTRTAITTRTRDYPYEACEGDKG